MNSRRKKMAESSADDIENAVALESMEQAQLILLRGLLLEPFAK